MREEDKALVERSRSGDLQAFEALIRLYQSRVYRTLYFLLPNQDDVEDIAQEVFIRVFKHLPAFRGDCEFSTWLHKVTLNTLRNWIRSHRSSVSLDDPAHYGVSVTIRDEHSSSLTMEDVLEIRRALAYLPDYYREALVLRHFHGLSYEEIAQIQNIPLGTVRSRLAKGRELLFERLRRAGVVETSERKVAK